MSRRKNRAYWAPTALPKLVRKQIEAEQATLTFWEQAVSNSLTPAHMQPVAEQQRAEYAESVHGWDAADCFWATEAMTRVALDASTDMPGFIPEVEAPTPAGILAFETSLPTLTMPYPNTAEDGTEVTAAPVDAIRWYKTGGQFVITPLCRKENFGPHPLDKRAPFQDVFVYRLHSTGLTWDTNRIDDGGDLDDPARASVIALLGAAWNLMQQPTVATTQPRESSTGAPRGPRQTNEAPSQVVTTVELRRMKAVTIDDSDSETTRTYAHRWVVRGHWRNQPHGKDHAQRRLQWVPSYVKGPEDAPLMASEKVMVWRR